MSQPRLRLMMPPLPSRKHPRRNGASSLSLVMVRQGLPVRGNSQLVTCPCGSPLDGIRSVVFLAKALACSSVCRLSLGSAIHSRMIFRRIACSGFMLKILCDKCRVADKRKPALWDAENASGGLLEGADLPRRLASGSFYCVCPRFVARIFGHQLSELMFDSDSRRKLELSSKMMCAHWLSCRNRPHAGSGVAADKYLSKR